MSVLRDDANLSIDGPFNANSESASFFLANDTRSSEPFIVKYPHHLHSALELDVCEELKLSTLDMKSKEAITPVHVRRVQIRKGEAGRRESISVLVMPQFCGTLASPVKWLTSDCLVSGAQRIISALNYLHEHNFVHMDVKADNIFISMDGGWYLGDFGSCVPVSAPIRSFTQIFYWERLRLGETPAEFRYDWAMLAVALIIQARVGQNEHHELLASDFKSLMSSSTATDIIDHDKLLAAIGDIQNAALRSILEQILQCRDAQLNIN